MHAPPPLPPNSLMLRNLLSFHPISKHEPIIIRSIVNTFSIIFIIIIILIIIIIVIIISATSIRKVKLFPILWDSWSKVALFDISWHFPDQNWSFHFHCHSYFIVVTLCRLLLQCSSWELSWYRTHRLFPLFPFLSFSALLVAR